MPGDSFGLLFKVTNWGESHGPAIGTTIEGCPPNILLKEKDLQKELDRRKPGQSLITSVRKENDKIKILSGISKQRTTGAPLSFIIFNQDQRSQDYDNLKNVFRPSHADYTYHMKYGIRTISGGGRSSARLTAGTVAAGAVAKIILKKWFKTKILAYVSSVQKINAKIKIKQITSSQIEKTIIRCPNLTTAKKMIQLIEMKKKEGDSLGGVIECLITPIPIGLGEPIYDKLEADLAKAMLSINACKGFEIGSGFAGTQMTGSKHNDEFFVNKNKIQTLTNNSGGVQGGISNGMPIFFRTAFKPTSTILKPQKTVTKNLKPKTLLVKGRHDPCVLPRAVPIVEALAALVLIDHALRLRAQVGKISYL
jgi:chorismate synthase